MTMLQHAVMDGDVLLRKAGSSAGLAPAIYATKAHAEAEAGKHRLRRRDGVWINPRVVKLGVIE